MVNQTNDVKHDLRGFSRALFDQAKKWQIIGLSLKLGVFAIGTLVILFSFLTKPAPFITTFLFGMAELCLWYSNKVKGTAESLLRKLDAQDSFGWSISKAEISDLLIQSPAKFRKRFSVVEAKEQYFASAQEFGPKRALENVQESAWWSKHLARKTWHYYLVATLFLVFVLMTVLIISIETIRNFDTLVSIGRVVTATIMLIFSLGLVRLTLGYYDFSAKAAQLETQIENLLKSDNCDDVQAIKVMHDYQLARASAPLLPGWVWKLMRDDLTDLWRKYRRRD